MSLRTVRSSCTGHQPLGETPALRATMKVGLLLIFFVEFIHFCSVRAVVFIKRLQNRFYLCFIYVFFLCRFTDLSVN
jgi:hypothetical protein